MKRFILYTKESTRIENEYRVFTGLTHKGKCLHCEGDFKSRSILAKYCSQRCKNDVSINRRRERILKKKQEFNKCIVCSTEITQKKHSKIIKYCSNKCKQLNYRKYIKKI